VLLEELVEIDPADPGRCGGANGAVAVAVDEPLRYSRSNRAIA
jgi:hypothetical protein